MATLQEQIANKCIHFNGVMNKCCEVGIKYIDVMLSKPYRFPCLNRGGECPKRQFLTEKGVIEKLKEIGDIGSDLLIAYVKVKQHVEETKQRSGKIPCECGGELCYASAANNHLRVKCTKCTISFME